MACCRREPWCPCLFSRLIIGRLALVEVRDVVSRPLFLLLIPPNKFLALAPGLAIGPGGGAVVDDANVVRPGKAPAVSVKITGLAFVGLVLACLRINAGVDPAAASGGAVIF